MLLINLVFIILFLLLGAVYLCPQCGVRYKHQRNLQRHLKLECGKQPNYSCTMCPYKAKRKNNLKVHMIRHQMKLNSVVGDFMEFEG